MRPALLAPQASSATLKTRPWGGDRLARWRAEGLTGPDAPPPPIGESWEFSTLPGSASLTGGQTLAQALGRDLPFLAKLIDTARPLSVQVHPDDDESARTPGKEEAWIILDADPGARILAGVRDDVDAATLESRTRAAVADATAHGDALLGCLESIEVTPGDVILVPARTPHAIGGGILLAEIQQPSDCTYRFFDYGSERPIHVDAALMATDLRARPRRWTSGDGGGSRDGTLLRGKHLQLDVRTAGQHAWEPAETARLLMPARGRCAIDTDDGECALEPGELRLLTRGPLSVQVPEGGVMVVGWIG